MSFHDPRPQSRLEATVFGLVQGVFFRQSTQREASRLALVGWVANQPDGTVRVVAEGDENILRQLLDYLHRGPSGARVERVEANWAEATGEFTGFRVRYL
ncbi:MAG: acylphosphatase [Anaerolineae bacterium]|nr:acylphosphatase [Promineifilum sp.]MCZ2115844.1 acylphosphatase [Anaerolineae bacterium]